MKPSKPRNSLAGWYHTGTDSYDYPEIKRFSEDGPQYADRIFDNNGPFRTFADAKRDLVYLFGVMVRMSTDALKNARSVKKPKGAQK